jgi:predicted porin
MSPESGNLQSDTISVTATSGPKQSGAINLKYSIDPDIQFEFVAEQYHSGENSRFRFRNNEDLRVTVGGRWQALGERYGHPFDLSFGVSVGRDLKDPSIGALVADARLAKSMGPYSISAQASGAIFADVYVQGFGIEATRAVAKNFHINLGTRFTNNSDTIWTAGVTKTFENSPFSIGLEATNAMGTTGLGTLYEASKPHLKVSVMWVTALDLL